MKQFTAIIHQGEPGEDGFWATCLEVPGANGQGETREECLRNLTEAVQLMLETEREEAFRLDPKAETAELLLAGTAGRCSAIFKSMAACRFAKAVVTRSGKTPKPAAKNPFHATTKLKSIWPAPFAAIFPYRFHPAVDFVEVLFNPKTQGL